MKKAYPILWLQGEKQTCHIVAYIVLKSLSCSEGNVYNSSLKRGLHTVSNVENKLSMQAKYHTDKTFYSDILELSIYIT